jgi:Ribbon-helix-helix protein, copG family
MIRMLDHSRRTSVTSITITVDDETAEALRRLVELEQRSEADIVRTALAAYAKAQPRPKGIGKYRSGRGGISVKARELIRKDVKDRRWP